MIEKADGLTQEIAAFIVRTTYEDLPSEALQARQALFDRWNRGHYGWFY